MPPITRRAAPFLAAAAAVPVSLLIGGVTVAAAAPVSARPLHALPYQARQLLAGSKLRHTFVPAGKTGRTSEPLTQPDDITALGRDLFTGFQNGVGPQGQPSADGNQDSTVVEFTTAGRVIGQWDLKGKCDGLTADPARNLVIATVNEDANSSLYTITPRAPAGVQIQHYRYNEPLPHHGGTDAISVFHSFVLISASAPGTTGPAAPQPAYPAVYLVGLERSRHIAAVLPLFYDEALATVANTGSAGHGKVVRLALTDPDSNEVVPPPAVRFADDFMLTSQGDKEQIFLSLSGRRGERLSVLRLSQSVDDTAWATGRRGRLYATDHDGDTVDVVTGRFHAGSVFVAVTPCDAGNAPATCPAPGFPPNYLGSLNPWTGQVSRVRVSGPTLEPQGMIFVAG